MMSIIAKHKRTSTILSIIGALAGLTLCYWNIQQTRRDTNPLQGTKSPTLHIQLIESMNEDTSTIDLEISTLREAQTAQEKFAHTLISGEIKNSTLIDIIQEIRIVSGVDISLNLHGRAPIRSDVQRKVDCKFINIPASKIIATVLSLHGLVCTIDNDRMTISSLHERTEETTSVLR